MARRVAWLLILTACNPAESTPGDAVTSAVRPSGESYLIVDADAGPLGDDDLGGAIFRWDRATGTVEPFVVDPRFVDPQRAARLENGDLLVLDMAAETPHGRGGLFRVDATSRAVADPIGSAAFDRPVALAVGPGDAIYVADRSAMPHGEARGAVFAVDLERGEVTVVANHVRFRAPSFLIAGSDGTLLLLDADARTGDGADEGVFFRIDPTTGVVAEHAKLAGAVSPLGVLDEGDGSLLVFDANADPNRIGGPLGAIFRLAGDGTTTVVASDHPFRDPVRGCFGDDGAVLFVDANADPEGRGPDRAGRGQNVTGGGAILALDRTTGAVSVLAAPLSFVNPVDIMRWP